MAHKDASPVSIRVRLKYPDLSTFIEKYAANVSQGGMFIQSRTPQPIGTLLRFEVMLAHGQKLLKGEGRVSWVRDYDEDSPTHVHGMGVRFITLDPESEAIVEMVLAHKRDDVARGFRVRSITQEVQALERTAQTEEEEPLAEPTRVAGPPAMDRAAPASLERTEQELQQLVLDSAITEAAIDAILQRYLRNDRPGSEHLAELEELQRSVALPKFQPGDLIRAVLSAPPAASSTSDTPPDDSPHAPFDPSLLAAAAHVSCAASGDAFDKSFDLSEATPIGLVEEPFTSEPSGADATLAEEPPLDEGWRKLRTATELLDHSSDRILHELAAQTSGGAEPASVWHEIVGEATAAGAPNLFAAEEAEQAQHAERGAAAWTDVAGLSELDQPTELRESPLLAEAEALGVDVDLFDQPTELRESPLLAQAEPLSVDVDLDDRILEALASSGQGEIDEPPAEEEADEPVPSLDDLAFAAHTRTDLDDLDEAEQLDGSTDDLQTSADDPPLATPTHRDGLFRRLFGKRRE